MASYTAISGIYAIRGSGSKIYIGQSTNLLKRTTVNMASRLGLPWTIIHRFSYNLSKQDMDSIETRAHRDFKLAGFDVVSIDRQELNERIQASITPEVIEQRKTTLNKYWDDPLHRAKQAQRIMEMNNSRTSKSRSVASLKGWETRRSNPSTLGQSKRTLSRRRADARRVQS